MANIHCPKCNAEISSLSLACPACQTPLEGKVPTARKHQDPGSFWSNFWGVLFDTSSTFQWILDGPDGAHVWMMILVLQLSEFPGLLLEKGLVVGFLVALVGIPVSYLAFKIMAWLYSHIGAALGGVGSPESLFKCVLWGCAGQSLVNLCELIGHNEGFPIWHWIWVFVAFIIGVWSFIVHLIMLSLAHRFSMWSAFWTIVLTVVLILGVVLIIVFFIGLFIGSRHF